VKIYLAGPMRGRPQFNFPTFHKAARVLRALGHQVFNPAERDEETYGKDFAKDNHRGDETSACQKGFSLRDALGDDLDWICREAEAICLLPGWGPSKGAVAEWKTAEALGLKVYYFPQTALDLPDAVAD
jgi:Domain of unknown function (DUF4406)